jgi:hypothetical protein
MLKTDRVPDPICMKKRGAVARQRKPTTSPTGPSRRTQIVWLSFAVAMTLVTALLAIGDGNFRTGFAAARLSNLATADTVADMIFQVDAPLDRERWKHIVIHHSGSPADDPDAMHRRHLGYGYQGLGYHFVLGNGNGFGDGVVHVGYRWNDQLPGAHATGTHADYHNRHSIAICLVGNGDRRPFTDGQINELVSLVRRLQERFDIAPDSVLLHRDISGGVTSPGRFFPTAQFEEQLIRPELRAGR